MMFKASLIAIITTLITQQVLAAPGIPPSNGDDEFCFNTWDSVVVPAAVQYWYMQVKNNGVEYGGAKANRMWHHLNMNGCAPTEHKIHTNDTFTSLTFHTSSACTAARVSNAYRSSTSPPVNLACEYNGRSDDGWGNIGDKGSYAFASILTGLFEMAPGAGKGPKA